MINLEPLGTNRSFEVGRGFNVTHEWVKQGFSSQTVSRKVLQNTSSTYV